MAGYRLVKCSACGTEVSNGAVSCPKCGNAPALSEGKTCGTCQYNTWHSCDNSNDRKACPGHTRSPK